MVVIDHLYLASGPRAECSMGRNSRSVVAPATEGTQRYESSPKDTTILHSSLVRPSEEAKSAKLG
jgi:hypothetical protein